MNITYHNIGDTLYPVELYRLRSATRLATHEIELLNLGENIGGNNFAFNVELEDETIPSKFREFSSTSADIIIELGIEPKELSTKEIALQHAVDIISSIEERYNKSPK